MVEGLFYTALFYGLISAVSLPLGALLGMSWIPSNRVIAFLLAFGSGALLAALTIDLVAPGIEAGLFFSIAVGAMIGGILFKILDYFVNQQGGYLRKPSTSINFWITQNRKKTRQILHSVKRVHSFNALPAQTLDQLINIISIREYPAGVYLYQQGDLPAFIYVIVAGSVTLLDPDESGKIITQLGSNDVFGRMSFYTGLRRRTEARIQEPTKLLCIPRQAFFNLLKESTGLRQHLLEQLNDPEISLYLAQRHGLSPETINAWLQHVNTLINESGSFVPPYIEESCEQELPDLLQLESRLGFFNRLSDPLCEQLAAHMSLNHYPPGHVFFNRGDLADRCFLLRKGSVYLTDPINRTRPPIPIHAGDSFGGFSFLVAGPHTMTAMSHEATEVWELRSEDFQELWLRSHDLREQLIQFLLSDNVQNYLNERQNITQKHIKMWLAKVQKKIAAKAVFPSISELFNSPTVVRSAPMAIYLGIFLDGIPESLVIGAHLLVGSGMSLSLISGLFLANFPEALSSAVGMKGQGFSRKKVLSMWILIMVLTGLGAGIGAYLLEGVAPSILALIRGLAAGAMLTMIAETLLPEAYHKGGGVVGLSTLAGFLIAILANHL
jgi:CRP-like cAMP-binding protein